MPNKTSTTVACRLGSRYQNRYQGVFASRSLWWQRAIEQHSRSGRAYEKFLGEILVGVLSCAFTIQLLVYATGVVYRHVSNVTNYHDIRLVGNAPVQRLKHNHLTVSWQMMVSSRTNRKWYFPPRQKAVVRWGFMRSHDATEKKNHSCALLSTLPYGSVFAPPLYLENFPHP